MTKHALLFDANAIYQLIRDLPDDAPDKLMNDSTIPLAYYELGNALWRECFLLRRISREEAEKSLSFMYAILERMQIITLDNKAGSAVLETACKLNLTFYDSAYLTEAKTSDKILVTEDKKLAKAAENFGVKTFSIRELAENRI
jgi:predicted nucleic acid-binding protein